MIEGSVAAMVDYGLRIWDVVAMQVIVREAGGRYEWLGTSREPEVYDVVFGKPNVVDWVMKRLKVSANPTGSRWSH